MLIAKWIQSLLIAFNFLVKFITVFQLSTFHVILRHINRFQWFTGDLLEQQDITYV